MDDECEVILIEGLTCGEIQLIFGVFDTGLNADEARNCQLSKYRLNEGVVVIGMSLARALVDLLMKVLAELLRRIRLSEFQEVKGGNIFQKYLRI